MNLRDQRGVTGVDITISVILITILISLITVLSYNIQKSSQDVQRRTEATSYAVEVLERVKSEGFDILPKVGDGNIISDERFKDKYIVDASGNPTGYYQEVRVEDYSEIREGEGSQKVPDLLKRVTVKISYKSGQDTQIVELSTLMSKES